MVEIAADADGIIYTRADGKPCTNCCTEPVGCCECSYLSGTTICYGVDAIPSAIYVVFTGVRKCEDDSLYDWNGTVICVGFNGKTATLVVHDTDDYDGAPVPPINVTVTRQTGLPEPFGPEEIQIIGSYDDGGNEVIAFAGYINGVGVACLGGLSNNLAIGDCGQDNFGYDGYCNVSNACNACEDAISWSSSATYIVGAAVIHEGHCYICVLEHTNHSPPNATYWLIAAECY